MTKLPYELVLELKRAGFPNILRDTCIGRDGWPIRIEKPEDDRKILVAPNLEELIEACGEAWEGFESLTKEHSRPNHGWVATAFHKPVWARGITPEEAVARLWLALDKKTWKANS